MAGKTPPIIIKKKVSHGGHHGGAWKVAYADFVTAMMALFIVLWLLNSTPKVKEAVAGYFQDPSGTADKTGSNMAGQGENLLVKKDDMENLKQQIEDAMKKMPNIDKLKDQIKLTVTQEGLRIEMLESAKGTFFESGSPKISEDGEELLATLGKQLGELPNHLAIEGHTDSKAYSANSNYGNWELSADRANTARRVLQRTGVRPDQVIQVRGFADQMLRKKDEPLDPSNRRVSVIVRYQDNPPGEASGNESKEGKTEGGIKSEVKEGETVHPAAEPEKKEPEKNHE